VKTIVVVVTNITHQNYVYIKCVQEMEYLKSYKILHHMTSNMWKKFRFYLFLKVNKVGHELIR